MSDVIPAAGPPAAARPTAPPAATAAGTSFGDVLASLNPLQHVPVVGTIYRAITGDVIPEGARMAGSLLFSGLAFGPFGLLTSAATAAFGKLTGLDADAVGRSILGSFEPNAEGGAAPEGTTAYAAAPLRPSAAIVAAAGDDLLPEGASSAGAARAGTTEGAGEPDAPRRPLLPAQLAAYGVSRTAAGALRREDGMEGADVLNTLELLRIGTPTAVAAARGGAAPEAA